MNFDLLWDANCETGESPVWDAARGVLWFCDSPAGRVLGYRPQSDERMKFRIDEPVGSLSLCKDGRLILALRDRIVLFDPERQQIYPFCKVPGVPEGARLNDGKVGPDGAFWVGAADLTASHRDICSLYRVSSDSRVEQKATGFRASNGLAWSEDKKTMFHSDSRGPWIDKYEFDAATGAIENRKRFATPTTDIGRPDGAACTSDGMYWSAGVSAGRLNAFDAHGTIVRQVPVPVRTPTMPCFANGGVFLTSLWGQNHPKARRENPLGGALFFAKADAEPVEVDLFDAENGS